nr:reverse transcriptase domain-containing protein [Tanacetum cinerariifolium]
MSGNGDHHRQVDSPPEATGMTGVILAMSRLKDFVNGFVNLKSIRSIDTKDSMRTHQPTQLSKNMKTKRSSSPSRFAARGNGYDMHDPRDVEIERLRQRVRELEINPFDRYERQYEDTPTDAAVEEYENEGRLCPDDLLDWLRTVDRIFDLRDTPDHIK